MPDFIHIHPSDNVAVALRAIPAGTVFDGVAALQDIPQGHKMALKALESGEKNEDELLESCACSVDELIPTLTGLTFSGIIKQLPGSVYGLDPLQTNIVY